MYFCCTKNDWYWMLIFEWFEYTFRVYGSVIYSMKLYISYSCSQNWWKEGTVKVGKKDIEIQWKR